VSAVRQFRAALSRGPIHSLPRRALLRWRYGPSKPDSAYLEALALLQLRDAGRAPLRDGEPPQGPLDVAFVIPPFARGSGGHTTLSNIVRALERRGHRCSFWLDDPGRRELNPAEAARMFALWFGPFKAQVHPDFSAWKGADVAVATGYQSVLRVRTLADCGARAYCVQDHEPDFFAASAERVHAEESYTYGFHAITAGVWLADVMRERYGMAATPFELAVDHGIYRPLPEQRRDDVVIFYARSATPRRAVPIGLAALRELQRRRPGVDVWLYGQPDAPRVDFSFENLGVVSGPELASAYARATVGLSLSLTNYSLVPQEMLACELPCVEAAEPSILAAFGTDGPVVVAKPEPHALADALERLLDDRGEREARARQGRVLVEPRTWDDAAVHVEAGLRQALADRAG
jgi:O-antigen biosynthesis protein